MVIGNLMFLGEFRYDVFKNEFFPHFKADLCCGINVLEIHAFKKSSLSALQRCAVVSKLWH